MAIEDHQDEPETPASEVHDQQSAIQFVRWCVAKLGLGYHPDTQFGDYVDHQGQASFTPDEVRQLDELQDRAFEHCDPYEVGFAELQQVSPELGRDMTDIEKNYAIPDELAKFVNDGFIEVLTASLDEKTIEFHIPSLRETDNEGRITSYSLTWIHPDHNAQFCQFYDQTPGDLSNFYVTRDTTDLGDEQVEGLETVADLIDWLASRKP